MTDVKVETVEIPEEQVLALEDAAAEEEWESDWGAAFWCAFLTVLVLCGLGIAAWQPWVA